jgi:hypothetical protein
MLQQCRRHGQPYRLDLDDLVHHQLQVLQRSLLDVVLQNLFLRHLDEVHLDAGLRLHLDEGLRDDLVQHLRHLDAELPDALCDPCPGSAQMGCCLDEPLDVEYPCPGSKRRDYCPDEGFLAVEPVPQVRRVLLGLESLSAGLLQEQMELQALGPLARQRQELGSQPQAWRSPS